MTIKGTPEAVQAVAEQVDKASRLPVASPDYPCTCGYHLIEVADYEAETVRCPACGVVVPAGDRAATIQVRRVQKVDKTTATYDAPKELEDAITAAKAKPAAARTKDEKALAAVAVEPKPAPPKDVQPKAVMR